MTTISLAKALKLKNRLAGRMSKVQSDIEVYNSVLVEQAEKVDVPKLIILRDELMCALSDLKLGIIKGNAHDQFSHRIFFRPIFFRKARLAGYFFHCAFRTSDG